MTRTTSAQRVLGRQLTGAVRRKRREATRSEVCPACSERFTEPGAMGIWIPRGGGPRTYELCTACSAKAKDPAQRGNIADAVERFYSPRGATA